MGHCCSDSEHELQQHIWPQLRKIMEELASKQMTQVASKKTSVAGGAHGWSSSTSSRGGAVETAVADRVQSALVLVSMEGADGVSGLSRQGSVSIRRWYWTSQ